MTLITCQDFVLNWAGGELYFYPLCRLPGPDHAAQEGVL